MAGYPETTRGIAPYKTSGASPFDAAQGRQKRLDNSGGQADDHRIYWQGMEPEGSTQL
jgi:hypothetical protein